jgi:hypothetical protein
MNGNQGDQNHHVSGQMPRFGDFAPFLPRFFPLWKYFLPHFGPKLPSFAPFLTILPRFGEEELVSLMVICNAVQ